MSIFRRKDSRDRESTQALFASTRRSYDEFAAVYVPADAKGRNGGDVLLDAAGNTDPVARAAIVNRLLDDGAPPTAVHEDQTNAAEIILGAVRHDFQLEAPLIKRLLDGGVNVNKIDRKDGTLLDVVAGLPPHVSEETYWPVAEVLLARPELDLTLVSCYGRTTLQNARRWNRTRLAERLEGLMRQRGIPVPPPE